MSSFGLHGKRSKVLDVTSASWGLDPVADGGGSRPVGIYCNAASTITAALLEDANEAAWILPAGFTPLAFRSVNTSSTTKTGMRIIFG